MLAALRSWNVDPLIVDAVSASLKMAETGVLRLTQVAPLSGETDDTVGGVTSTAVVNFQLKFLSKAFPATSFTPEAPPVIVAVYTVKLANTADGVKVAVLVAVS